MPIVGRLDQYASILAYEFDETTANNPSITGLGTYYASEFSENVGIATTMTANVFAPYDPVYDEFAGVLYGPGQGRYMRQNTDKSVIVYNEIDEIGFNPSGIIIPSTTSVNEGSSVIFNVISTNVESGTTLYYDITGSAGIASADFTNNSLSGSLVISGTFDTGFGSTTLTLVNDGTTEGTETFNMNLRTGSISGPIVTTSPTITISDTSVTPPPSATVTPSTSSVNEGSGVTFTVNTTNFTSGTLYWTLSTISGTINTSDFTGAAVSGSFSITSSTGSVALTLANDTTTEGTESFQLEVRTDSTSGTIIGTSTTVTINDTSLTPAGLYSFTTATFNTGNLSGRVGPTLAQAKSTLTGPEVAAWRDNTAYFNMVTNGIQLWTVPATASYTIIAAGAAGFPGSVTNRGANIRGTFSLTQGQIIQIIVGQQGTGTAGGGGSYVIKNSGTTNADIYVIAGGGGGKSGGAGGTATTSNSSGTVSNGNGGNAQNSSYNGPAGGGFFTSGTIASSTPRGNVGSGFLQGGVGGLATSSGAGGFGGGGSGGADSAAGGGAGGGYSGGSGSSDGTNGQGAGSYPNGTSQTNTANSQSGNGFVTITKL